MTWSWADALGYLAFVLNVVGNLYLTGRNQRLGFGIRLVPNILWAVHACFRWDGAVLANAVVFFVINSVGFYRHSRATKVQAKAQEPASFAGDLSSESPSSAKSAKLALCPACGKAVLRVNPCPNCTR